MGELRKQLKCAFLALELANLYDFVPEYSQEILDTCIDNDVMFYDIEFLKKTCSSLEGNSIDRLRESICNYVKVEFINN